MRSAVTGDMMGNYLISARELHDLDRSACVIFDCRFSLSDFGLGRRQYAEGHVPGAFHLDMEDDLSGPKGRHGGRHPIPDAGAFAAKLRGCGVNDVSLIVAYDGNRLAGAARLWWLLRYFGHEQVRILDGGLAAWQANDYALTTDAPVGRSGNFRAKPGSLPVADQQWVRDHLDDAGVALIDSREPPRHQGLEEPIDPVAGHIPGAINAPWQNVTTAEGIVRPAAQQRLYWQFLPEAREYVVYCGSGVTAAVSLFSLEMAGISNTRLYAGSFSDWCSYPDNEIAKTAGSDLGN